MSRKSPSENLVHTFEHLLEGHGRLMRDQESYEGHRLTDAILAQGERQKRRWEADATGAGRDRAALKRLIDGFLAARSEWAERQRATADDFNLFDVMGVARDEARHSRILAWLLDRRIEHGTHAQGNLGFRLFVEELGAELGAETNPAVPSYAEAPYWVRREVGCSNSIVDVEIAAREKFVIHIENKIDSGEGENQTNREWKGLLERGRELSVPEKDLHGIYLTLDGSPPENKNFRAVGWSRIVRVLEKLADKAQPPEVKLFARHYGAALRRLVATEPQTLEAGDGRAMVQ